MKNLNNARVNVMISDMNQSIEFYVDRLGFTILNRYNDTYCELDAKGLLIALHPTTKPLIKGDNMSIGLGVVNFDETIKELGSNGISFKLEMGGYIRLAHFSDPDGNLFFLAENK